MYLLHLANRPNPSSSFWSVKPGEDGSLTVRVVLHLIRFSFRLWSGEKLRVKYDGDCAGRRTCSLWWYGITDNVQGWHQGSNLCYYMSQSIITEYWWACGPKQKMKHFIDLSMQRTVWWDKDMNLIYLIEFPLRTETILIFSHHEMSTNDEINSH